VRAGESPYDIHRVPDLSMQPGFEELQALIETC
jgi:hypothetical protein